MPSAARNTTAMATRTTRGAAAKEAAFLAATEESVPQQLTSPPPTPALLPKTVSAKGSRSKSSTTKPKVKQAGAKGQLETPDSTTDTTPEVSGQRSKTPKSKATPKTKKHIADTTVPTPAKATKKRKRASIINVETDPDELPHGLGKLITSSEIKAEDAADAISPPPKRTRGNVGSITKKDAEDVKATIDTTLVASALIEVSPGKRTRKKRANAYGVTLGETPYPGFLRPTPEECDKVNHILSIQHGEVRQPKSIPLPSLTIAGCGEVPCILEALMRTLLSAHTSNGNAAFAVQGLIKRFGVLNSGMSEGSIDWNAARLAGREEILEAIKRGGLANSKSKNMAGILDSVYEENQTRRAAIAVRKAIPQDTKSDIEDDRETALVEKAAETMLADSDTLTLDYVHAMSNETAFAKLITLPGIGVKTAACTLLFCMQRPSFAVDTHVFRLCKWLGWVPDNATRDTTFAHCDVRIPNELKYSLHQLLIRHGKTCGRCRAITGEKSEGWDQGCPLEDLVKRTGAKKGGIDVVKKKGKKSDKSDDDEGLDGKAEKTEMKADVDAEPVENSKTTATKTRKARKGREASVTSSKTAKPRAAKKANNTKATTGKTVIDNTQSQSDSALSEPDDDDDEYMED